MRSAMKMMLLKSAGEKGGTFSNGYYHHVDTDKTSNGHEMPNAYGEARRGRDSRGRFTRSEYGGNARSEYGGNARSEYGGNDRYEYGGDMRMDARMGGNEMRSESPRMTVIGFGRDEETNNWPLEYERTSRMTADYPRMHEANHMRGESAKMGHAATKGGEQFGQREALEWAEELENEDGTTGAHWTPDQVRQLIAQKRLVGIDPWEFYAVLNSLYSDYCKTFEQHGLGENVDIYVDMAKAFINDKDAKPGKVGAYYRYIAKR